MHVPLTEVILTHGGAELARATFAPSEYIIGREPRADLRADTPLLSRQHARLTINYDHLLLENLASSNGTFVNDRPLAEPTRLFPLASLTGLPLKALAVSGCPISDFTPLLHIPTLASLATTAPLEKLLPLRTHPGLKVISHNNNPYRPVAGFWAEYDAQQAAGK